MKIGDRVTHEYLGDGEIVNDLNGRGVFMVKCDKTPNIRYNMGENPTLVFKSNLTIIGVTE